MSHLDNNIELGQAPLTVARPEHCLHTLMRTLSGWVSRED